MWTDVCGIEWNACCCVQNRSNTILDNNNITRVNVASKFAQIVAGGSVHRSRILCVMQPSSKTDKMQSAVPYPPGSIERCSACLVSEFFAPTVFGGLSDLDPLSCGLVSLNVHSTDHSGRYIPPITVAARSKGMKPSSLARTLESWVRIPLKTWMSACLYSVCVVLCVGSGLATGWSPVQGVLLTVYGIKKLKKRPRSTKGSRATDR
jgi:hypothetical protein